MINTETSAGELYFHDGQRNTHGDGDEDKQQQLGSQREKAVALFAKLVSLPSR